jgi:hypothetical protein
VAAVVAVAAQGVAEAAVVQEVAVAEEVGVVVVVVVGAADKQTSNESTDDRQ